MHLHVHFTAGSTNSFCSKASQSALALVLECSKLNNCAVGYYCRAQVLSYGRVITCAETHV